MTNNKYQQVIRDLSERIVTAQRPIRILDALKWNGEIEKQFFASQFKELPKVTEKYYENNPLRFDPEQKIEEFSQIERDIRKE
jgi:hypothetical protein